MQFSVSNFQFINFSFTDLKFLNLHFMRFILLILLFSCTDNQKARYGGKREISIKGEFINISWDGDDLWVITKDSLGNYHAKEYSSFGVLEGEVIIKPASP